MGLGRWDVLRAWSDVETEMVMRRQRWWEAKRGLERFLRNSGQDIDGGRDRGVKDDSVSWMGSDAEVIPMYESLSCFKK